MPMNRSAADLVDLPPLPEPVTSFGAVTLDGWLYVFGGHRGERHQYSSTAVSGALRRLRLDGGNSWETLPDAAPAQGVPLAAHGKGFLYRPGGMTARNAPGEKGDLHSQDRVSRFDVARRVWEEACPMPEPRSSHDAVVAGDRLVVGGGWGLAGAPSRGVWSTTVLILDLANPSAPWQAIEQPFRRRALAMAAWSDQVYFMGGIDGEGETSRAVDILDLRSGSWSRGPELPPGPMGGFGGSAVGHAGRVFFSGLAGDLHALEPGGSAWRSAGRLRHPRFFHRLAAANGAGLIAVGGEDGERKVAEVERLTPEI